MLYANRRVLWETDVFEMLFRTPALRGDLERE